MSKKRDPDAYDYQGPLPVELWEERGRYKVEPNGCWIWQQHFRNGTNGPTYSLYDPTRKHKNFKCKRLQARPALYEHYIGPVPAGFLITTTCGRPDCVAPDHFELQQYNTDYGKPLNNYKSPLYEIDPVTNCWRWLRNVNHLGYPYVSRYFQWRNKNCIASRALYTDERGPIPAGMYLVRTCNGGKRCVNPDHFQLSHKPSIIK